MTYIDPDHCTAAEWDDYCDARNEARQQEWEDKATECPACGCLYDPGYHPATRWEPAEYDRPECPQCEMSPDEAEEYAQRRDEIPEAANNPASWKVRGVWET